MMDRLRRLMLSCREATELLSDACDTQLSFSRRVALRAHLMMCHLCRRYKAQIRLLNRAARRYGSAQEGTTSRQLSDSAKQRIKQQLRDESER